MLQDQIVELDLSKVTLTGDGVKNFYWPVSLTELQVVCDELRRQFLVLAKQLSMTDPYFADIFNILFLHLFNEVLAIYQVCLLKQRATLSGYQIATHKKQRLLFALENNILPTMASFIKKLQLGPPRPPCYGLPLRWIRDFLIKKKSHIRRFYFRKLDVQNTIMSITADTLAQSWSKQHGLLVGYVRASDWFFPITDVAIIKAPYREILTVIKNVFLSRKNPLPKLFEEYLERLIQNAFALVNTHIQRIDYKKLPWNFWSNTGGSLWTRMLSHLVRKMGGKVTRFDHAGGVCFFNNLDEMGPRELENCDTYVTFSQQQAENLSYHFSKNGLIYNRMPKIEFSTSCHVSKKMGKILHSKNKTIKRIMYVPTIFPGERIDLGAGLMSDVVLLDWQIRLLHQVKKWGYSVILKPHPEGNQTGTDRIKLIDDIKINRKRFEKVIHRADILLIDMPASTTFPIALISNKPIIYLHFDFRQLNNGFLSLLQQRCSVVNCWLDQENRAQVDWNQLYQAIFQCVNKNGREIVRTYYNFSDTNR